MNDILAKEPPVLVISGFKVNLMFIYLRFGNEEQKQKWIPKLATMDALASYCLTEVIIYSLTNSLYFGYFSRLNELF